jgi:hypothetical protein
MPYGLLTFVDERGVWPVRGTCTGDWSVGREALRSTTGTPGQIRGSSVNLTRL